jgi:hypothetical protein
VIASVATTSLYLAVMEGHVSDGAVGAVLSAEHPTDTRTAVMNVHDKTAAVTRLHITRGLPISRVNSRCISRIVETLERPRDMYSAIWLPNCDCLSVRCGIRRHI